MNADDIKREVKREMEKHERDVRRRIEKRLLSEWHKDTNGEEEIYTRHTADGRCILISNKNFWGDVKPLAWYPCIITKVHEVVRLFGSDNLDGIARLTEDVCGISHAPISEAKSLKLTGAL